MPGQYLARGVDALFTNDPAALIVFLKQLNSQRFEKISSWPPLRSRAASLEV
jgi:hypothetical protein